MALPLRRSRPRGSVGLDLDGCFVAAVGLEDGRIARATSAELEPGIVSEGEVADAQALSDALKRFFKDEGLPPNVLLGVANQQIAVRELELPRIEADEERDAAVRFLAAEAVAMPLDETVLDYQVVGQAASPEGAVKDRVVVVAARAAMIDRLVAAVRGAGLRPLGIDLSAFALVRALSTADEQALDGARAFCHLGGVTNLAVAVGRSCVFTRPLAVSVASERASDSGAPAPEESPRGAQAAADPPRDPVEEAPAGGASADVDGSAPGSVAAASSPEEGVDAVREPAADPSDPGTAAAFGADAERAGGDAAALAEEIRLSIDFYMGQPEARWVGELILSGPGSTRAGLAEELSEAIGLPVSIAEPLGRLDAGRLPAGEDPHRHTVAAGLALGEAT